MEGRQKAVQRAGWVRKRRGWRLAVRGEMWAVPGTEETPLRVEPTHPRAFRPSHMARKAQCRDPHLLEHPRALRPGHHYVWRAERLLRGTTWSPDEAVSQKPCKGLTRQAFNCPMGSLLESQHSS